MVYKLGRKLKTRRQCRLRLLGLGCAGVVLAGTVATVYAATSHGPLISSIGSTTHGVHTAPDSSPVIEASQKQAAKKPTLSSTAPNAKLHALAGLRTASCTLFPPKNPGLSGALTPELRKLAQYEQLCNGDLISRSSFFAPTPTTIGAAQADAADMASRLHDYAKFGITPLVFLEPDTDSGADIDLVAYSNGAYDVALDAYFADLKADGVTDNMMGLWVLFPEGNLPVWSSVNPQIYAADVTKTAQAQKQYFPASQDSLMLDSETYLSANSWSGGAYVSLAPYVQSIPKGLIDSFGLQGFPWAPPANQGGQDLYNPQVYLQADLAAQAAHTLGVNHIWFNTGTFHQMYTNSAVETVTTTPLERQAMLSGVVAQAQKLQGQGFSVAIHLFAQNKANTSEAIDWSYWPLAPDNQADTAVLTTFVHDLAVDNIPLWLFDTYDQ